MAGCTLCPRSCGADRGGGQKGRCHVDGKLRVARAALHFWEEPCISGEKGSGAVFFSGCPLGCVYCQNQAISRGRAGTEITSERLARIFLKLEGQGAHNLNLVTAGHYVPQVLEALSLAKKDGFSLPVVWNSSGYETVRTLRMLDGFVDIYLPDLKYLDPGLAKQYSGAEDYPAVAKAALGEMVRQCPSPVFNEEGLMTSGVIARHLLLPGHVREAKRVASYLYETYGNQIYISLMNQYTPPAAFRVQREKASGSFPALLARKVTKREYDRLLDYAAQIGIENGFFQEGGTADESFIPEFDGTGV
ncbi:MAG: 4Fe-4S cluster-binding domain-containing protein [Lachnospiraceae bacterium]|nr:4Fe-4S cluster-binding domain-containing protein [Lachnospiraceae bacterium]